LNDYFLTVDNLSTVARQVSINAIIAIGMNWLMKLGFLSFIPGNPSYVVILVAVFGSIYAGKLLYKKELQVD